MTPATCHLLAAAAALVAAGCSVSSHGLDNGTDAAAGGASGTAPCPSGLTQQAGWPAGSTVTSCARACGPDYLGAQTCKQSDLSTCKKEGGCVCLEEPCVTCADCTFWNLPDCYVPTNTAVPPTCEGEVGKGKPCAPACGKLVCLRKDGKTACICNDAGKYACGDWGASGWK
jgi:hypothetical protein